jgi:hypothetical protein
MAFGARLLSLSASSSFILLLPLAAFASSLAVFWLLVEVTGDPKEAAVGVLIILLCGVFASPNPLTSHNNYYAVFSFLRRYLPAVPFPLFFVFCVFVWQGFTTRGSRALWLAAASGVTMVLLIYSYFYLWSAALAWFFCFTILWLVARPVERGNTLRFVTVSSVIMLAGLVPYLYLVSLRSPNIDRDQALVLTHAPDLFRFTELIGFLACAVLIFAVYRRKIDWKSPAALFAFSTAITPILAFNQQVITGRSLQPFHYEQFVLNYLILVGAVVTDWLVFKFIFKRQAVVTTLALVVGTTLAVKSSIVNSQQNLRRDEAIPILIALNEDFISNRRAGAVLIGHTLQAAAAPTSCSMPVLWSPYAYNYGTISFEDDRERLFQYLYYLNLDVQAFEQLLKEEVVYQGALFGVPRINRTLTQDFKHVSPEEIRTQVDSYALYTSGFTAERARKWPLSHVVVFDRYPHELSNLDRWYERDGGEHIESATLYRVRLKSTE